MTSTKPGTRAIEFALVFFGLVIAACSPATRQVFFDIQPPEEQVEQTPSAESPTPEPARPAQEADARALSSAADDAQLPRPALESVATWDEAKKLLPQDGRRGVDWMAALDQGLIRPRTGADPEAALAAIFKYDFMIEAEDPTNEAYFPHSAHTQWLGCKNCHTALFAYRRNPATMKDMMKGSSCGYCHGRKNVAFSLSNCARCHPNR